MKYLVMECHPAYAVVLDEKGRFIKVANFNYEVGQTVTQIVPEKKYSRFSMPHPWVKPMLIAACVYLVLFGLWQFLFMSYGSVSLTFNPEIKLTVNRLDRVIRVEGLNFDGALLLSEYPYRWKPLDQACEELTDRAKTMNYLTPTDTVYINLESEDNDWIVSTGNRLPTIIGRHTGEDPIIVIGEPELPEASSQPPVPSTQQPAPSETDDHDDDHNEDDDEDGDEEDDDDDDDDDSAKKE